MRAMTGGGVQAKYHAVLTFRREELLYDIRNNCYIEGHIMSEEDEHRRHMTKDVGEAGNVDRVSRTLNLLHSLAVEMLYPLAKHEVHVSDEGRPWHDRLAEPEEYRIDLLLPEGFSQSTVNLLERLIHEWMVDKATADWLSITNTDKAVVWESKAARAEEEINEAKAHRMGRIRRTQTPF